MLPLFSIMTLCGPLTTASVNGRVIPPLEPIIGMSTGEVGTGYSQIF